MLKAGNDVLGDEAAHLCQRALYVEPLNHSLDTIKYPTNGHEHIHLARKEAAEAFPEGDFSQCMPMFQNMKIEATIPVDDRTKKFLSLRQWKNNEAYFFSNLASKLKLNRKQKIKNFPRKQFPLVENEKDVCLFCLGSELYKKIFKNEDVHHVDGCPPLQSIVLYLSQEDILSILRYMNLWVTQIGMTCMIGRWTYSLLACLEKPVSDECEEFLESFHDECVQKIKNCDEDEKNRLHLITAILKNYFCVKTYQVGPSLDRFLKLH